MITLNCLPITFQHSWCIAGGFAACPALADDVDVWVWGRYDLAESRQTILDHLKARHLRHTVEAVSTELEASQRYGNLVIKIEKVAVVSGGGKPIHIMVTDAPCPEALVSAFDISTHAVAFDNNFGIAAALEFTHPGELPRLMEHANDRTPERLGKILARFGHGEGV